MNPVIAFNLSATAGRRDQSESSSYRFLANIASADMNRALRATKIAGPAGEFRLVPITCSELGLPLKGAALYVLSHLPEPEAFWELYHSQVPRSAA